MDGAKPGHQMDLAKDRKLRKYAKEFPGFSPESSPSRDIISVEHLGSWSKSTRAYWDARVVAAHTRQMATMEFSTPSSLSVMKRRVLQFYELQTLAIALWHINACLATSCSSTAEHVLVLSKYGTAPMWRSWQLAQARATKQT